MGVRSQTAEGTVASPQKAGAAAMLKPRKPSELKHWNPRRGSTTQRKEKEREGAGGVILPPFSTTTWKSQAL